MHLTARPERRQRQPHAPLVTLRRRRQHPLAPLRRISVKVHVVSRGPFCRDTACRVRCRHYVSVFCGHGTPCPYRRKRNLYQQPLLLHLAEGHPLQRPLGHLHAAVVHHCAPRLGRGETPPVKPDKQIPRAHPQPCSGPFHAHLQCRLHATRQTRRRTEYAAPRLLPRRARIAYLLRRAAYDGPPARHVPHHGSHAPANCSQYALIYLCHNRFFALQYKGKIAKSPKSSENGTLLSADGTLLSAPRKG